MVLQVNMAADRRRLQVEIDRTIKKVNEGVEAFADVWHKLSVVSRTETPNATSMNQKEKYEQELKKEIKKLQRLREQIKTWQSSSDIKDKKPLTEARKQIEAQMERFKVIERETKQKPYSKDALGNSYKYDYMDREKEEINQWIQTSNSRLSSQIEDLETKLEDLNANKKKRMDKDKIESTKHRIDVNKKYIDKLEKISEMLKKNSINVKKVQDIKEDVEYYVDNNDDLNLPENLDGLDIFDDLDLDKYDSNGSSEQENDNDHNSNEEEDDENENENEEDDDHQTTNAHSNQNSNHQSSHNKDTHGSHLEEDASRLSQSPSSSNISKSNSPSVGLNNSMTNMNYVPSSSSSSSSSYSSSNNQPNDERRRHKSDNTERNEADLRNQRQSKRSPNQTNQRNRTNSGTNPKSSSANSNPSANVNNEPASQPPTTTTPPPSQSPFAAVVAGTKPKTYSSHVKPNEEQDQVQSEKKDQENINPNIKQIADNPAFNNVPSIPTDNMLINVSGQDQRKHLSDAFAALLSQQQTNQKQDINLLLQQSQQLQQNMSPNQQTNQETFIQPILGVAPLGKTLLTKEQNQHLAILDGAFKKLPQPSDTERSRNYLPRIPVNTPSHYPQVPPVGHDSLDFLCKLNCDTLFFMFYYMEGTKAQFLAAQALKKLSWRFHTRYMMWFQRYEEPKVITDEYEMGTYVYFDYSKWAQNRKDGFTFEYKYLEDKDLSSYH